jgi:citrate lyase beta subunit
MSFNRLARLKRLALVPPGASHAVAERLPDCDAVIIDGMPGEQPAASSLPLFYSLSARADDPEIEMVCGRLALLGGAGIFLRGCDGVDDIQKLDVLMSVAETEAGLPHGRHAILADLGSTPAGALLALPRHPVSHRLSGLVFDGARLAEGLSLTEALRPDRPLPPPIALARAHAILFARAIQVAALVSIDDLAAEAAGRAEGFSGVLLVA